MHNFTPSLKGELLKAVSRTVYTLNNYPELLGTYRRYHEISVSLDCLPSDGSPVFPPPPSRLPVSTAAQQSYWRSSCCRHFRRLLSEPEPLFFRV